MFKVLTIFLLSLLSASQILAQELSGKAAEEFISERDQKINEMLSEMTEEKGKVFKKFLSLDWKFSGTHHLAESHSSITLPEGYSLVLGNDAKREQEMPQSAPLEAVVYDETYTNSVLFSNFKSGYISLDNWNKMDSMAILEDIKKSIEQDNEERKKKGTSGIFIGDWIQQPILDRATNTVCWAIGFKDEEGRDFVNSGAIRLYREGFETIGWITERASFVLVGGHLDTLLQAHSFDPGFEYEAYREGDPVANYGIAELVATSLTSRSIKVNRTTVFYQQVAGFVILMCAFGLYKLLERKYEPLTGPQIFMPAPEEKIRKKWFVSLMAVAAMSVITVFQILYSDPTLNQIYARTPMKGALDTFFILCSTFYPVVIAYCLGFKLRNATGLMCIMILWPLRGLQSLSSVDWKHVFNDPIAGYLMVVFFGVQVMFWINCLRLYRVYAGKKQDTQFTFQ